MKSGFTLMLFWLILIPAVTFSATLNDVFHAAQPMAGYDKVLILENDESYTGGLVIFNEKVAIWGNGATVDLQNNAVIAIGKGILDIDGCVFVNGGAAVSVADEVFSTISHCVFYNNEIGIQHFSTMATLKVYNSVFMNNVYNAVYTNEENLTYMEFNLAYNNPGGHYVAGCGS